MLSSADLWGWLPVAFVPSAHSCPFLGHVQPCEMPIECEICKREKQLWRVRNQDDLFKRGRIPAWKLYLLIVDILNVDDQMEQCV